MSDAGKTVLGIAACAVIAAGSLYFLNKHYEKDQNTLKTPHSHEKIVKNSKKSKNQHQKHPNSTITTIVNNYYTQNSEKDTVFIERPVPNTEMPAITQYRPGEVFLLDRSSYYFRGYDPSTQMMLFYGNRGNNAIFEFSVGYNQFRTLAWQRMNMQLAFNDFMMWNGYDFPRAHNRIIDHREYAPRFIAPPQMRHRERR